MGVCRAATVGQKSIRLGNVPCRLLLVLVSTPLTVQTYKLSAIATVRLAGAYPRILLRLWVQSTFVRATGSRQLCHATHC